MASFPQTVCPRCLSERNGHCFRLRPRCCRRVQVDWSRLTLSRHAAALVGQGQFLPEDDE